MEPLHRHVSHLCLSILLTCASQALAQAPPLNPQQQQEFLRTAEVIGAERTSTGVTRPWRLTLIDGTRTHDGLFQSIDQQKADQRLGKTHEFNFVDSYRYNIAAYELAALVGLSDMIPVTVERTWNGQKGALSWWIDDVMFDEATRVEEGQRPADVAAWSTQVARMRVFEELVHDTDRNKTNMLYTSDWKLYMIDFTRAFRTWDQLQRPGRLVRIDGWLFERLKALTDAAIDQVLGPLLTRFEVSGVLKRRDRLVGHFEDLIEQKGEALVLR